MLQKNNSLLFKSGHILSIVLTRLRSSSKCRYLELCRINTKSLYIDLITIRHKFRMQRNTEAETSDYQ